MARKVRPAAKIDSRSARLALPRQRRPHGYTLIAPGVWVGYRRTKGAGTWDLKVANGKGDYWHAKIGPADDYEDADNAHVFDFWQACERGRAMARGQTTDSRPATWAAALDTYEADLRARAGDAVNASRVRHHLTSTLASKPVALLTAAELRRWRDDLIRSGISPATVVRTLQERESFAQSGGRSRSRASATDRLEVGLSGLIDTYTPRNVVLPARRAGLLPRFALDPNFGLVVDVLASTGTRTSQACRLLVADLQAEGPAPRLMMPSSRKGKRHKEITRKPVPIPASLAHKLKQAAGDRDRSAPLLTRADGSAWNPNKPELVNLFAEVARRTRIEATAYSLRHSSVVRMLLAATPTRVTASVHDTSTLLLEKTYSAYILDHADALARRGMLDTGQPAQDNVVGLPRRS